MVLTGSVISLGVGLVAILGRRGDNSTWARWSSVGEAFGVVNSVVAAFALAALVITYMMQSRDLRLQREDLALQRGILESAEASLRRSADVDVRKLHVSLIQMATQDARLAEVWPSGVGTDEVTRRQHMYANLLLQHVWLQYTAGIASKEEMISNLRHLFTSPRVRAYWEETAKIRRNVYVDGTEELTLAMLADAIWREYENVLACTDERFTRSGDDNDGVRTGWPPAEAA
jgi:hypothetical protein